MATPPDFSVGQVLTAAHMDAIGLWLVASGSATSGSELIVDGCFTTDFANYQVVVSNLCTAAADGIVFQLRASGSTLGTNGYYGTRMGTFVVGGALTSSSFNNAASAVLPMVSAGGTTNPTGCTWTVLRPQTASKDTGFYGQGFDSRPAEIGALVSSGFYNATTQADGFRISCQSSTFTSISVKVYGLRD